MATRDALACGLAAGVIGLTMAPGCGGGMDAGDAGSVGTTTGGAARDTGVSGRQPISGKSNTPGGLLSPGPAGGPSNPEGKGLPGDPGLGHQGRKD